MRIEGGGSVVVNWGGSDLNLGSGTGSTDSDQTNTHRADGNLSSSVLINGPDAALAK